MLRNYLTAAWRTLRRSPTYTTINVGGLALGKGSPRRRFPLQAHPGDARSGGEDDDWGYGVETILILRARNVPYVRPPLPPSTALPTSGLSASSSSARRTGRRPAGRAYFSSSVSFTGRPSAAERSAAKTTRWLSNAVSKSVSGIGLSSLRLSTNASNCGR